MILIKTFTSLFILSYSILLMCIIYCVAPICPLGYISFTDTYISLYTICVLFNNITLTEIKVNKSWLYNMLYRCLYITLVSTYTSLMVFLPFCLFDGANIGAILSFIILSVSILFTLSIIYSLYNWNLINSISILKTSSFIIYIEKIIKQRVDYYASIRYVSNKYKNYLTTNSYKKYVNSTRNTSKF